jgi:hypothetical protein
MTIYYISFGLVLLLTLLICFVYYGSEYYTKQGIKEELKRFESLMESSKRLSELYAERGMYKSAQDNYIDYLEFKKDYEDYKNKINGRID